MLIQLEKLLEYESCDEKIINLFKVDNELFNNYKCAHKIVNASINCLQKDKRTIVKIIDVDCYVDIIREHKAKNEK